MTGLTVRRADITDMPFIMALQRSNRESVGGLPSPAIEERVARGTLALALLNGDPCGYLMYDIRAGVLRLPQACIQYDARRRTYGEALWLWVVGQNPSMTEARLRCAADIDANLFWQQMGFTCVNVVRGGTRRGRLINCWQRWFGTGLVDISLVGVSPAAQVRQDCFDEQTGFMTTTPDGFIAAGALPQLAWANRPTNEDRPALVAQGDLFGEAI